MSKTYEAAPTDTVDVGGTTFAYRQLGPEMRVPVIALNHLGARSLITGIPGSSTASPRSVG